MSQAKIAIITGASRGIGAATAQRLAVDGYDVCVNYLTSEREAQQVVELVQEQGVRAIAIQADVSDESQVASLFESVDAQLGSPQVLINNAGILMQQACLLDIGVERIERVLAVNVTGSLLCCKQAVKRMSFDFGGQGGVIVNVSSAAARLGAAGEYIDYAASKGAVDTLTIGLAKEVAEQGIRVNAVRPGYIYTDMHAAGGEPNRVDRLKNDLPLKRGGQASEVAAAIAWLVSDQSSYTTGSFIDVAGGR